MSRSTISTFQLFETFPTEESARLYLESQLWPDGPVCPECAGGLRTSPKKRAAVKRNGKLVAGPVAYTHHSNLLPGQPLAYQSIVHSMPVTTSVASP